MTNTSVWKHLEHGPLIQLQSNLWHVEGELPHMAMGRRMCIARRGDGSLVIHSAVALDEATMAELEALGPVAFLLVPSGFHRMDAARFHERYPQAKVLCPRGSRNKVAKVVAVDGSYDDFPEEEGVSLRHLAGMKEVEGVMLVGDPAATSLVFNDAIFNVPHGKGMGGLLLRVMGSSGGPKVTRIMRLLSIKDKQALAADLAGLAKTEHLVRLVPGHGAPMEEDAPKLLEQIAASLCA